MDALNELVAETERLGLYDDEAKMMDDADMRATRDKRVIIERIYAAWCKVPHLRLGQFLWQSIFRKQSYGLFNVPDLYLCDMCEYTVKEHKLAEVDQ